MNWKSIKTDKSNTISIVLFLVYILITFFTVLNHEVWSDEAQAWLLARDTNFVELIKLVRIEGHPLLWYFLITPFAKLINSFNAIMSMQILNWFFVIVGMGIFVFKSPFNNITKFTVLFSSGFLYWYPVIARSYCLIPILIFLLATLYSKQKEHPFWYVGLLVLLANTHSIMFGFCAALGLIFTYNCIKTKNKANYLAIAIGIISAALTISYLWGSWNENLTVSSLSHTTGFLGFKTAFGELTKNIYEMNNIGYYILLSIFLIFSSIIFFIKDKKIFFIYISNIFYQFLIYIYCWGTLYQRAYTLILITIFCFWAIKDIFKEIKLHTIINLVFTIVLFFSIPNGLRHCLRDILFEHSGGKATAKYIIKNIPENAFILVNEPFMSVSISAYIPKNKIKWKFFSQNYNNFYTYTNYKDSKSMDKYFLHDLDKYLANHEEIYIILSRVFFHNIKPIFKSSQDAYTYEIYEIYKIQ